MAFGAHRPRPLSSLTRIESLSPPFPGSDHEAASDPVSMGKVSLNSTFFDGSGQASIPGGEGMAVASTVTEKDPSCDLVARASPTIPDRLAPCGHPLCVERPENPEATPGTNGTSAEATTIPEESDTLTVRDTGSGGGGGSDEAAGMPPKLAERIAKPPSDRATAPKDRATAFFLDIPDAPSFFCKTNLV